MAASPLDEWLLRAQVTVMPTQWQRAPEIDADTAAGQVRGYVEALLMVAASTFAGLLMSHKWGNSAVDLLYLPAVIAAAILGGRGPALVAALISALAYNYWFTQPVHTLQVHDPVDIVTVVILFLVALVTSQLAALMRMQARRAAAHAARNATVAGLARRLLSCSGEEQIGDIACRQLFDLFGCNALLLSGLPELRPIASYPDSSPLTPSDIAAAVTTVELGEPTGRGAPRLSPADWLFYPVSANDRIIAAMGLARDDGLPPVAENEVLLLNNLLDQVALALERARLEADTREVDTLRERDRLRGALLSSVGHDLRTPLTAIAAAAAELRRMAKGQQKMLAETVTTEAAKLERYIANLLDMARIEAGSINLSSEPIDLVDSIAAAARDLRPSLADHSLEVDVPSNLPLVRSDASLLHHCLINILDNAARYSPAGQPIEVHGELQEGSVRLSVVDRGKGFTGLPGEPFETFTYIRGSDRKGGTGLGLAIVKGFADAMGVQVAAGNRKDWKGAVISLTFPPELVVQEMERMDGGQRT
jgi:two-component system sensor histidine kinase KdpD